MPPLRSYLKKRILVQNDAKLMPIVVQGGREYPTGGASGANAYRGKYLQCFEDSTYASLRAGYERPTPSLG